MLPNGEKKKTTKPQTLKLPSLAWVSDCSLGKPEAELGPQRRGGAEPGAQPHGQTNSQTDTQAPKAKGAN